MSKSLSAQKVETMAELVETIGLLVDTQRSWNRTLKAKGQIAEAEAYIRGMEAVKAFILGRITIEQKDKVNE
jgi:hypothetical protein